MKKLTDGYGNYLLDENGCVQYVTKDEVDKLKNAIELALFHARGMCDCDNIDECNTRIVYVLNQSLKWGEHEKTNTKRP